MFNSSIFPHCPPAVGIHMARADGADWLLHIDTDEMIYPGGTRDYSLQQTLGSVPPDVDLLVFPNYESLAETAAVEDPFVEVSLFKRNYAHVVSDFYFDSYATVARGNPNYFTTYGNGKSAARVIDGLRPNGAHRWHNYNKEPKEWSSEQGAVLHYTYNRFSDLISRRDRCDCAPTKEDAERCFILPFDRQAFLEASLKTDAQLMKFFKQRLVWDNVETVGEMLQKGLFVRLYEPQLLVRGFLQAIKQKDAKAKQAAALTGGQGLRQEADVSKAAIAANSLPSRPAAPEKQQLDNKPAAVGIDATENVAVSQVQGDSVQEEQRKQALNGGGKGAT